MLNVSKINSKMVYSVKIINKIKVYDIYMFYKII